MLERIMDKDKIFTAAPIALPGTNYKPYGELYEDFYTLGGDHLIQSGKFYIREYFNGGEDYTDILIDPETLEDVTDPLNPVIILGCDLARAIDLTYYTGENSKNE